MPRPELQLAVIGNPVSHSLSPAMHQAALKECGLRGSYDRIRVSTKNLGAMVAQLRRKGYHGFNVTIPHKEAVAPFLNSLDENARRVGAVNTVTTVDGGFRGYNTDTSGFGRLLDGLGELDRTALILGAGGAARACIDALIARKWKVTIANRTPERTRAFRERAEIIDLRDPVAVQEAIRSVALLVNTTPVGMNQPDETPLPERVTLANGVTVIDLVYAPLETRLLVDARAAGCPTVDGLELLAAQAADAFELWTGSRLSDKFFREAALEGALMSGAFTFQFGQFGLPSLGVPEL